VYRLANVVVEDHVYTIDVNEVERLRRMGTHRYEGVDFYTLTERYDGTVPLYRIVLPDGRHMLGIQPGTGAVQGGRTESILGYIDTTPRRGLHPLRAWYNAAQNVYFYTAKKGGELAPASGYAFQGILGYVARVD